MSFCISATMKPCQFLWYNLPPDNCELGETCSYKNIFKSEQGQKLTLIYIGWLPSVSFFLLSQMCEYV